MRNKISNRSYLKCFGAIILLTGSTFNTFPQNLPGFRPTNTFNEQEITTIDQPEGVTVNIDAPLHFNKKKKTYLVFFALPNGNGIEWTKGKRIKEGDDWHFNIQHIAAQARFVRSLDKKNNYVVVYLMTEQKSWPAWKRTTAGSKALIKNIVDSVTGMFKNYHPGIVLSGHSGGGSFIFGYLDAVNEIQGNIDRIAFLDSNYGYEDSLHRKKIIDWLKKDKKNKLVVLAYNDSVVIYNGKPLVSPTGGTWYRSRLMQRKFSESFHFSTAADTSFIVHEALNGRIKIILKENPGGLIYHTVQVEKNGFIFSLLSGTGFDKRKYFIYFGERVYEKFIVSE